MRQVTQADLQKAKKGGGRVKRRMGESVVEEPVAEPETQPIEQDHASMAASMEATEANQQATHLLLAQNAEMIAQFQLGMESLAEATTREPADYDFKVLRDEDKLIDVVQARHVKE